MMQQTFKPLYTSKSGGALRYVCYCTVLLVGGVTPMPDILLWYRVNKKNKKKLMRVFKFHANSQGVKQTLEPKGYPRIREPKENLNLFPL